MYQTKIKKNLLGGLAVFTIAFFVLSIFSGGMAGIKGSWNAISISSADDGEDDEEDDENEDKDEDEDEDEDDEDGDEKQEKATEEAKKRLEREREVAKKQAERENKQSDSDDNEESEDDNEDNNEDDGEDKDENGMYKDKEKTLEKLREKIEEARKEILEKQAEGADVTAALARLALAETSLASVASAFDANDLETAKRLTKEARKLAHFAKENDLHDAKETTKEIGKVAKRIAQIKKKLTELKALGSETGSFETMLAEVEQMFSDAQAMIAEGGTSATTGFMMLETTERRAKTLKHSLENALYALGGDDDEFDDDYKDEVENIAKDLDDVAELEDDGIGSQVRAIARAQRMSAVQVSSFVKNAEDRSDVVEALFGADDEALKNIEQEIVANQVRISLLTQLLEDVEDADVRTLLNDQIKALQQETTKLQGFVDGQASRLSLFGWFFNLF